MICTKLNNNGMSSWFKGLCSNIIHFIALFKCNIFFNNLKFNLIDQTLDNLHVLIGQFIDYILQISLTMSNHFKIYIYIYALCYEINYNILLHAFQ